MGKSVRTSFDMPILTSVVRYRLDHKISKELGMAAFPS